MKGKWISGMMVPVIVCSLLAGCTVGGADQSEASLAANNEEQLSFSITYVSGDMAHKQGIATVIADFEKSHPNIAIHEINETTLYGADFLRMKDSVGEFPDVMEMLWTQEFAGAGLVAELPDDLAALFRSVPEVNGKVFNAPLDLPAPQGIIYNKQLFRAAGIEGNPKTFDEFLEICEQIKRLGVPPLVVGGKDYWHMGFWVNKFLIDDVLIQNPDWNSQRTNGDVSWTDPGPKTAFRSLKTLWDNGYVAPDYLTTTDYQTASVLASGQAAMLFSGPWMFNQILAIDPDFELGFFALPDKNGKINLAGAPTPSGWSISAEAAQDPEKLKIIKQFLHFFFSEEEYPKYLKAVNGIPSTREAMTYPAPEAMQELLRVMNDPEIGLSRHMNGFWGENEYPPRRFLEWFYKSIQDWLAGKASLEEVLKEADQEWDKEMKLIREP